MYSLPTSVDLGGTEYAIRTHYSDILEIIEMLEDPELSGEERAEGVLIMFYPDALSIPPELWQEAIDYCLDFIAGGERQKDGKSGPKLVSWKKDFPLIVGPVNHTLGMEIRSAEYLHWWTFLAAYQEIGECTFSQVVRIRDLRAKGKKLNKDDREWYRKNRHLVDIPTEYTESEKEFLKQWGI